MDRREFLKLGGFFSAALLVQFNPLAGFAIQADAVEAHGNLYRGTSDGKVLVSPDIGSTWHLHTDFGSEFSVTGLATDHLGNLRATLEFTGHPFDLAFSQNASAWKTV